MHVLLKCPNSLCVFGYGIICYSECPFLVANNSGEYNVNLPEVDPPIAEAQQNNLSDLCLFR